MQKRDVYKRQPATRQSAMRRRRSRRFYSSMKTVSYTHLFFADPDSVRTGASVRVRYFCRDICGKHRGGARGDPEYISDYIPAHGLKGRTLLGHACDGGRKSGRIAVLFPWKF